MAIIMEVTYSKKLGLPNYSSHSYVVSIRTELSDLTKVEDESNRLYTVLQQSVDKEIQEVGFLPDGNTYGMNYRTNGNGHNHEPAPVHHELGDNWCCSEKQKELVLKLVEQHQLDKNAVEALAKEMFGLPVKTLDRHQASGLIEELIARHGKATNGHNNGKRQSSYRRSTRS